MPELPEVETIRRTLAPRVRGRTIREIQVLEERLLRNVEPEELAAVARDRRIGEPVRRGKYLVIPLEPGAEALLLHLRMTGRLLFGPPEEKHVSLLVQFADDGPPLRLVDTRKFAMLYLIPWSNGVAGVAGEAVAEAGRSPFSLPEGFARLGPEPLSDDWTVEGFWQRLEGRRQPIKSLLLNQEVVAGIGNIYADEALFRARIHPLTAAGEMSRDQAERLFAAVREVLAEAIAWGGTTFRDYQDAQGKRGEYVTQLRVYGREGEPCPECGTTIELLRIGGRSAHFCPRCQERAVREDGRGSGGGGGNNSGSTLVIGLTGGIASGKSTVLRLFREAGAETLDADEIVHRLEQPGEPVYEEIVAEFGREFVRPDGSLDRQALGRVIFADPRARERLNRIVHPRVIEKLQEEIAAARARGTPLVVVDVPLLFEVGFDRDVDRTVVVKVPAAVQLRRLMERDGLDETSARQRLEAQWPLAEKVRRADYVIDNSGTVDETRAQVWELVQRLKVEQTRV
ncbi:MAG: bifunctional DNA-formamidopyrimidine glycosylase/DNA-(apurinic or apyrimidinic site) lyase [Limnochordales bacterium]|nr:bifunctional DNA-formamidopyrimidine glycosylase/DNA-(apurinic or apyrimidinic site) lyase [Limnochordales bacterium]